MSDEDNIALISSAQKPVMKYLLFNNKYFNIDDKGLGVKNGKIVSINGSISKNCFRFSIRPRQNFGRL